MTSFSKSSPHSREGGVFPISSAGLKELLSAVVGKGRPFRFQARGLSMHPFVKDGDILTVSPYDRPPRTGDIVAFCHRGEERLIVHRIVAVRAEGWIVRGDNSEAFDDPIVREEMLGLVTRVERNGRPVRLALGPLRRVTAVMSRKNLLRAAVRKARRLARRHRKAP